MSMAIKRASYTGDPGFFGDIFRGAVGAVKGAVGGFLGRQPPAPVAGPGSYPLPRPMQLTQRAPVRIGPINIDPRAILPGGDPLFSLAGAAANGACPPSMGGYHLNKSEYFLKSGEFVPAGSRYVRNRKRNPANARATSRAISRVVGAKRYASSLSRISIRKKG